MPTPQDPHTPTGPGSPARPADPAGQARSLLNSLGKGVFWVVLIRGILAIILGILLFTATAAVAVTLALFIGAWLLVDGVLTIISANSARKAEHSWGWELAAGIAYIIAGIAIALAPLSFAVISAIFILWMLTIGMLVRGIFSLASKSFSGWSKVLGVIDILFAVIMAIVIISSPGAALAALVWIVAIYTIVFGIFLIIMAFVGRSQTKKAFTG